MIIDERALEVAAEINKLDYWDLDLCTELCELAGMLEEFEATDDEDSKESPEDVLYRAAEKLGVEI